MKSVTLDFDRCYNAVSSRDRRFDGRFVVAVRSTGIYCRPSCPARTPARKNVEFHLTSAAAQRLGFRACKRCRPDTTPGDPQWVERHDVVARAMRLIADGVVDRDGVSGLARSLGYSVRQLERVLVAELGAGPLALARAQRAQVARTLIESTDLPLSQVAFAAGFASVRQFNDTVRAVFACSPTELRGWRTGRREPALDHPDRAQIALNLRLPFRRPLEPQNLFGHLAATAVPGVEEVVGSTFRRTLNLPHGASIVALTPTAEHISCRLLLGDMRDLAGAIARCRSLLDLDADPEAIDAALAADRRLLPLVRRAPGRRVPRTVDGAEMALRAVLGQQVSTAAARTHAARLVSAYGQPIRDPEGSLTSLFPTPDALVDAVAALPERRLRTLRLMAERLADGSLDLTVGCDWEQARTTLRGLPGVGPWTVDVIAMRALGDPDVLLSGDLGVRAAAASLGLPDRARELAAATEHWAPWRSYAVQYLWATQDHEINRWPPTGHAPAPKEV